MEQKTALAEFIDQQIADRVELVRAAQRQADLLNGQLELLKGELYELIMQKGEGWSDSAGYARVVAEGVEATYDTKALDELILKEPVRYGWLGDFRKREHVRPAVKVK